MTLPLRIELVRTKCLVDGGDFRKKQIANLL
jgi:hypothetical protein